MRSSDAKGYCRRERSGPQRDRQELHLVLEHRPQSLGVRGDLELAKTADVVRVDQLEMRDVRAVAARPVASPGDLDRVEGLPNSSIADRMDVRLEAGCIDGGDGLAECGRFEDGRPALGRRVAREVEVGTEHGRGHALDDAVCEELDAGRGVAWCCGSCTPLHELGDLLGAAHLIPAEGADHPARELATTRQGREGDILLVGPDVRLLPVRDPDLVEGPLADAQRLEELVRRRWWEPVGYQGAGILLERADRTAVGIAFDASAGRVDGRARDAGHLQPPRVHPGRVAVAALEVDRTVRDDPVEVCGRRDAAREVGHRPAATDDPGLIRVRGRVAHDSLEVPVEPAEVAQVAP